jgi:hypothetical protein
VTGHGNLQAVSLSFYLRIYLFQFLSCSLCLRLTALYGVLIIIQTLAHRVRIANLRVINKGDIFDAPTDKITSQLASQCTSPEEETFG